MTLILTTNVIACRPSERRPTAMLPACAKNVFSKSLSESPITLGLTSFQTLSVIWRPPCWSFWCSLGAILDLPGGGVFQAMWCCRWSVNSSDVARLVSGLENMTSRRYGKAQSWNVFYSHFFIKFCLPSKVVFHQRLSSINGCLPSKVIFHHRLSPIEGCLPT